MPYKFNIFTGTLDIVNAATSPSGLAIIVVTGTVNDSNKAFTAASTFTFIVVNGQLLDEGNGFSKSGLSITLDNPVGTGGRIFAI